MKLNAKQATEIGNALLDAVQNIKKTGKDQDLLQLDTGEVFTADSSKADTGYNKICKVYE